jgi:hypothetical protein
VEFNTDHEELFDLCKNRGFVNEIVCAAELGWSLERFQTLTVPLIQEGILWIDVCRGKRSLKRYFFPKQ